MMKVLRPKLMAAAAVAFGMLSSPLAHASRT